MDNEEDTIIVKGNFLTATSEMMTLKNGTLNLYGDFSQKNHESSFYGEENHTTFFRGNTTHRVYFENSLYSHFGKLEVEDGGSIEYVEEEVTNPLEVAAYFWYGVEDGIEEMADTINALVEFLEEPMEGIVEIVKEVGNFLGTVLKDPIKVGKAILETIGEALTYFFNEEIRSSDKLRKAGKLTFDILVTIAVGYGVEALKGTNVGSKIVSVLDDLKVCGKEGLDRVAALTMSGKVGAILKDLKGMADDAAYALFQKITDNKLSRKILEVADKWNRKKDGKLITEEQAKILIEEAEDGTEADEILAMMEKAGIKSLGFDDLMKRLTTKAGSLLSEHWDDLSKEAKETITNVIEKTTKDGRKLSRSGTEILLDEYADKTEEALTKKILYFTTEHMETGIDNNAFKILRKEWDGWDDAKRNKVNEIIQKCGVSPKMLTEDDISDILASCDKLSVDVMVNNIVLWGKKPVYKEVNIHGPINSEIDEVDFINQIIYEDKDGRNLYMENPDFPQTEQQWAESNIFKKGGNRLDAINQSEYTLSIKGSEDVPRISAIKRIKNYVFRVNVDTPALREAVEYYIEQLRVKYPEYTISATYGG